jgi:hypothetical protein
MMTTFRAHFDGRALIPDDPVELPTGCPLQVQVMPMPAPRSEGGRPLAALAEMAERLPIDPDSPGDAAAQHDHYLYGTPKRP